MPRDKKCALIPWLAVRCNGRLGFHWTLLLQLRSQFDLAVADLQLALPSFGAGLGDDHNVPPGANSTTEGMFPTKLPSRLVDLRVGRRRSTTTQGRLCPAERRNYRR